MRPVRSERGSLPVVMLAILIVGSLITVLVGTVVVGQRQTRFDQAFEQALPVAEAGLERMVYLVRSGQRTDSFSLAETAVPGGRYAGSAVRVGRQWTLTATGRAANGTRRTVTVTISTESVFGVAAFGRTQVVLRGSNSSDSYRSGTFDQRRMFTELGGGSNICRGGTPADPFNSSHSASTRMCTPTGKGVVATNGELYMLGGVIESVDQARIHYARERIADPLPDATGFCSGVTQTCSSPKLAYVRDPNQLDPDPVSPPGDLVNQGSFAGSTLPAGRQLYTNLTLDSNTVVQGTPENPSVVYLTGTLTIPNGAVVNFRKNALGDWIPKPSPGLLIFSAGIGPALRLGNHASFSGAVWAPRATFSGGAAGNIYGALATGSISTEGSWNFHYDEALGDVIAEARRTVTGWAER
ncbi:MAG TPA: hypothetical protein VM287_12310 [Egibacteraceae bacterium]|nr:hypothetical protein [Egibacteraceae bacterium]